MELLRQDQYDSVHVVDYARQDQYDSVHVVDYAMGKRRHKVRRFIVG